MMVFSGVVFEAIGLTYTADVDILVFEVDKTRSTAYKVIDELIA